MMILDIAQISGKLLSKGLGFLGKAVLGEKGEKIINDVTGFLGCSNDELADKLNDPEIIKALKEFELKEIDLFIKDKQSARNREIEIVKATGKSSSDKTNLLKG